MSTQIEYIHAFDLMVVHLDPGTADSLRRVSTHAGLLLHNKKVRRLSRAHDTNFWSRLENGALRLQGWARGWDCKPVVDGDAATNAHLMVCLLASRPHLKVKECQDLEELLGVLDDLVPSLLPWQRLPPWADVMETGPSPTSAQAALQEMYETLRQTCVDPFYWRVKLSEAVALCDCLRLRSHPAIQEFWKELNAVTHSHRDAIRRLAQQQLDASTAK